MKIAITGEKGFIGKHLVLALKNNKKFKLRLLNREKEDLFRPESLKSFVGGKDYIIHLAGVNRGTDAEIISGNIVTTHNLAWAVKNYKSPARIVYISSIKAEGDSVYGLSKRLAEKKLESFARDHGLKATILRLTNVFGEGCRPFYNSVIATFCHQISRGEKLSVSDSSDKISFIYVGDLVKIITKEILAERKTPFYFKRTVTDECFTVKEIAEMVESFSAGKKPAGKNTFHKKLYNTYQSYL